MIILRLLLLLTNLHLKLLSTQGTGADKLLSTQRVKLLDKIDVSKASGPNCIPGRILQNLARELAPVLHFIFEQSLNTGDLPAEWTLANVAPIFKKGSKLQAVNYRPVSLTCISCKLFEHIVCKHILGHLEDHEILTDLQIRKVL